MCKSPVFRLYLSLNTSYVYVTANICPKSSRYVVNVISEKSGGGTKQYGLFINLFNKF